MKYTDTDRTIALAGLFQATSLVNEIAFTGNADPADFETCIQSLFRKDVATAEDTYGSTAQLETGLQALLEQLEGRSAAPGQTTRPKVLDVTKYAIGIMVLERKLRKNPEMLQRIGEGIDRAQAQAEHFTATHENVVASLAHLYTETISTLQPRIMVNGEHAHISNPAQADRIRALLLAAIRAAILWRQCGGNRWQLFFKRRRILEEVRKLLGTGD